MNHSFVPSFTSFHPIDFSIGCVVSHFYNIFFSPLYLDHVPLKKKKKNHFLSPSIIKIYNLFFLGLSYTLIKTILIFFK